MEKHSGRLKAQSAVLFLLHKNVDKKAMHVIIYLFAFTMQIWKEGMKSDETQKTPGGSHHRCACCHQSVPFGTGQLRRGAGTDERHVRKRLRRMERRRLFPVPVHRAVPQRRHIPVRYDRTASWAHPLLADRNRGCRTELRDLCQRHVRGQRSSRTWRSR